MRVDLFRSPHAKEDVGERKHVESGNLAHMVAWVMNYPVDQQAQFDIRKDGKRIRVGEIQRLSRRDDFPARNLLCKLTPTGSRSQDGDSRKDGV